MSRCFISLCQQLLHNVLGIEKLLKSITIKSILWNLFQNLLLQDGSFHWIMRCTEDDFPILGSCSFVFVLNLVSDPNMRPQALKDNVAHDFRVFQCPILSYCTTEYEMAPIREQQLYKSLNYWVWQLLIILLSFQFMTQLWVKRWEV